VAREEAAFEMSEHELDGMQLVGPRLREARKERRMTLADVATSAGLTPSFLSLAERGKTRVSVPALLRLCAALEIPIGSLFDFPADTLVPSGGGGRLEMGGAGITEYILTPADETGFVVMQTILQPGGGSGGAYTLDAQTVFVFVVKGELSLAVGGRSASLVAGDSMTFSARTPHEWTNPSARETEVLWTIAPALALNRVATEN
jgi:transcriptional regulator with XRE-family HTH domain